MSSFVKSFLILFASLGGHCTIGASCGGVLTNSSGIIMSPGFPQSYANDLSCDWDIICPVGNKIILTFTDIDVEHAGSNCFDSIKIFEDINASSTYEVCDGIDSASEKGSSILLNSSTVRIRFTSDSTVTRKGFMANYTFVPNNCVYEYNTSSGIVLSPNYAGRYPSNIQCVYSFSFGPNQVLALRFLSFELEKEVKDGSCSDFVRLRNANFKIYGEFCGKTVPRSFSFYQGKAWMMFSSDKTKTEAGFSLSYEVKNITECLQDPLGESYAGQINVTSKGSACARWDSTLAMKKGFSNLLDQENYCRNPNNQPMPWCFNEATELPEYCNISFCEFTTSTEKTTTTTTTPTTTTKPTTTTTTSKTTTPSTTTKTQTPTTLSTTTTLKNNLTAPDSMVLSSTKVSTDFIIIVIVVPVLLLILIFGIAIAVVRFLVKKKKMSAPITQLRSIVNPNYVSKDSVLDGYIEALENDEISRQSIVAAHESVMRMSRKYSRSQPNSVYQSLEDVVSSGTLERKQSSKEESPYVEATNTYDVLRQKRGKKVDPNDFKTYSEVSIISEGNENYDHSNTTSRVFENYENQEIYTNTPSLLKNVSDGQTANDANVSTTKLNKMKNEMPSYATINKKRHSSFVSPKPVLPELTSASNIRFSTGEKIFKNSNKSIGENENDQPVYSQPDKTRGMVDDVLSVLDKSENPNSDDENIGGSNEQPVYATVHKTRQGSTKDPKKPKVPDPVTSGKLGGEVDLESQQQQDKAIASVALEEEEAIYEEADVQYDQLRRQRTRRNRNLGVKVSIYSEILPDTSNDEGIYSNTESGRRMIKSEQVMEARPPPSAEEPVIKTAADSDSPAEQDTNEAVIESSRL